MEPSSNFLLNFLLNVNFFALFRCSAVEVKLILKMNYYNLQQNALSSCEEMRSTLPIADQNGPVVCPKPRRVGVLMNMPVQPLRLNLR